MCKWKKCIKRSIALLLAGVLTITGMDVTAFATETKDDRVLSDIIDMGEYSIESFGDISLIGDEEGIVELKEGNYEKWIDRIDIPQYGIDFYNDLIEWTDSDGIDDYLISDEAFAKNSSTYSQLSFKSGKANLNSVKTATVTSDINSNTDYISKVLRAAFDAFLMDHPEVFWLTGSNMVYYYSRNIGNNIVEYEFYYILKIHDDSQVDPFDMRNEAYQSENLIKADILVRENAINTILNTDSVVNAKNDYEIVKAFNEWLTKNNEYNTLVSSGQDSSGPDYAHICLSALTGNEGGMGPVCESYAEAFKLLCERKNIPCVVVTGPATSRPGSAGESHAWNFVKVDGYWYAMDVTWNDPAVSWVNGKVSGYENENYLLVGSETVHGELEFQESHRTQNTASTGTPVAFINGPVLSKNKYVFSVTPELPNTNTVTRIVGENKYDTSLLIADVYKEILQIEKFGTVIVTTGENFSDALSASYLAYVKKAPILLANNRDRMVGPLIDYIKENVFDGGTIYILNNEETPISSKISELLGTEGYQIKSLTGKDRYDLNLEILKEAEVSGGEILVASGEKYADSLSASATGKPILIIKGKLYDEQKKFFATLKDAKFQILGGESAVTIDMVKLLEPYGEITGRIAGEKARETSVKIAETYFTNPTAAVIASAKAFPDGFCAGPLAAELKAPLLITQDGKTEAAEYAATKGIETGYVIGGEHTLNDETVVSVYGLEDASQIILRGVTSDKIDFTSPEAPEQFNVDKVTSTSALLSWTPSISEDVVEYDLYMSDYSGDNKLITSTSELSIEIENLIPNRDYIFNICAVDEAGNISDTCRVWITTLMPTATQITDSSITLEWEKVTSSNYEIEEYEIIDMETDEGLVRVSTTTATIEGLEAGKKYTWGIRLVDAYGRKSYPMTFTVTTTIRDEFIIKWDIDGNGTVDDTTSYKYGETPSHADGVKPADAQYTYTFTGWSPTITSVTGDKTYTAQFEKTPREYTIKWDVDGDGKADDTATYTYGETPSHADGVKPADAQYTYTFTGWSPAITSVTGDKTYTAQFNRSLNCYTIKWDVDGDGTPNDTATYTYGETPSHADGVKPADAQYTYTFTSWSPTITSVTGDKTYTAQFSSSPREYTIKWDVDGDGTPDDTATYTYGETPSHADGVKPADAQYTYTFTGWSPAITSVTGDKTYTAQFVKKEISEEPEIPDVPDVTGVIRVAGKNRYETSLMVAETYKTVLGVERFKTAIVATGNQFADALPGSYLAYMKKAPILLTNTKDKYMNNVVDYIVNNVEKGAIVYILGGESAVSKVMDSKLITAGFKPVRLGGKNRYETNVKILEAAGVTGGEIIVATGENFADSLSASATKKPILLVKNKFYDFQAKFLSGLKDCKFYIVGGTGAVSLDIVKILLDYGTIESRIAGTGRRETSVLIAKKFFDNPSATVIAYEKEFPDGLCGGPLAAELNIPLLLTREGKTSEASAYVQEFGIKSGYVLGGNEAMTDKAVMDVYSLKSEDEIK